MVGCGKKGNPPKPENFTLSPPPEVVTDGLLITDAYDAEGPRTRKGVSPKVQQAWADLDKATEEWEKAVKATAEWYDSLVVCLHCGKDLAAKGAKVCPECLRDQRD